MSTSIPTHQIHNLDSAVDLSVQFFEIGDEIDPWAFWEKQDQHDMALVSYDLHRQQKRFEHNVHYHEYVRALFAGKFTFSVW